MNFLVWYSNHKGIVHQRWALHFYQMAASGTEEGNNKLLLSWCFRKNEEVNKGWNHCWDYIFFSQWVIDGLIYSLLFLVLFAFLHCWNLLYSLFIWTYEYSFLLLCVSKYCLRSTLWNEVGWGCTENHPLLL